ncbi:hypothetical protein BKA69DRAFT_1173284 [Paraphysoderma sedebokerense]|nr:hypothetical protein BKA69DRAFT_1173284 [Paraphysoderma sedebokerense]
MFSFGQPQTGESSTSGTQRRRSPFEYLTSTPSPTSTAPFTIGSILGSYFMWMMQILYSYTAWIINSDLFKMFYTDAWNAGMEIVKEFGKLGKLVGEVAGGVITGAGEAAKREE